MQTAQAIHSRIIDIFDAAADGKKVRNRASGCRKVTASKYNDLEHDFYAEESIPIGLYFL